MYKVTDYTGNKIKRRKIYNRERIKETKGTYERDKVR